LQHPFPDFTELQPSTLASSVPAVLDRICEENGEGVSLYNFDIADAMSHDLTEDGFHPTAEGHKVLGQNLAEQLGPILTLQSIRRGQYLRPDARSVITDE
jgi:lysophospholipase L1-like esterase